MAGAAIQRAAHLELGHREHVVAAAAADSDAFDIGNGEAAGDCRGVADGDRKRRGDAREVAVVEVDAVAAVDRTAGRLRIDGIVAAAGVDGVDAGPGRDVVAAVAGLDGVVAGAGVDHILFEIRKSAERTGDRRAVHQKREIVCPQREVEVQRVVAGVSVEGDREAGRLRTDLELEVVVADTSAVIHDFRVHDPDRRIVRAGLDERVEFAAVVSVDRLEAYRIRDRRPEIHIDRIDTGERVDRGDLARRPGEDEVIGIGRGSEGAGRIGIRRHALYPRGSRP